MTLLQLGERLMCETESASRLLKNLMDEDWVQKSVNPADGRAVLLSLTPRRQRQLCLR
jgi:DNA-binding MarR family transcriptional regulator